MKAIEVETCRSCPDFVDASRPASQTSPKWENYYCNLTIKSILDPDSIPQHCPLPDKEKKE